MMTAREVLVLDKVAKVVEGLLTDEPSGHDWWHIVRVTNLAKHLAASEAANSFICQLASLVHDLIDDKLPPDRAIGLEGVTHLLLSYGVSEQELAQVVLIISTMSYKAGTGSQMTSLEGQIVQDADRLDALGAIGIARTMAYSGHHGRLIHHPDMMARQNLTLADYRSGKDTAIMHCHEKLLTLKDLMNTQTAKKLAEQRHAFLETYLEVFFAEWEGKR